MKKNSSTKTRVIVLSVVAFVLLASFLVILLFNQISRSITPDQSGSVTVNTPSGGTLIVDTTGSVSFTSSSGVKYSDLWSRDKVSEFLLYLRAQYQSELGSVVNSLTTDELLALIEQEIEQSQATPTPSGSISEYFGTPTPSSNPSGGGGGGGSGGGGGGNGGGGGSGGGGWQAPSWCRVWKLSYCADVITPSPSQTSSPTPTATVYSTPLPPDCSHPGNQITGKTVIGGELCIPLPTP